MKLYYSPGACSLAVHILLNEIGLDCQRIQVDLKTHLTETGQDFRQINAKGYVPALQLETGQLLTETAVLLQYLADLSPSHRLLAPVGELERYQCLEWLNFLTAEIHKNFAPLFHPRLPEDCRPFFIKNLAYRFKTLTAQLQHSPYLAGEQFSLVDPYLFTLLGWCSLVGLELESWPELAQYRQRLSLRPSIQLALSQEPLR